MKTAGCASDVAHEEFAMLLDMIAQEQEQHMRSLLQHKSEAEKSLHTIEDEIGALSMWTEFTCALRQKVESGALHAQAALAELVPRKFNSAEFVSHLHEFKAMRKAS